MSYQRRWAEYYYNTTLRQPAPLPFYDKVDIGDVGYIRDGQFHLLFKAGRPLGDRVVGEDVPKDFKPIYPVGPIIPAQPRSPGPLTSRCVRLLGSDLGTSFQ